MILKVKSKDWIVKNFESKAWKTLLKQLEDAGYDIPYACNIWTCWACMCWVGKGGENLDKSWAFEPMFPLDDSEVLTCCATVKDGEGEVELIIED